MKVIKRDGRAVDYNRDKIITAIEKANSEVKGRQKATKEQIKEITNYIEDLDKINEKNRVSRRRTGDYRLNRLRSGFLYDSRIRHPRSNSKRAPRGSLGKTRHKNKH